eukprot:5181818-Amphidinium_carterae.1
MVQDGTAVTRITEDAELATTRIQKNECSVPGIKQSVYRAELHAVARALEECSPHEVVSDCKGVVKAAQAFLSRSTFSANALA